MKLVLLLFMVSLNAQAQIAASSFFGETKSRNPGVITDRVSGFFTVAGTQTNITKSQEFQAADVQGTDPGEAETAIGISDLFVFRGGKGGGDLTTEFQFNFITGLKTDTVTTSSEVTEIESKAQVTNLSYGMGFKGFGLTLSNLNFKYNNAYSVDIGGSGYSSSFDAVINMVSARFGWSGKAGSFYIGALLEAGMNTIKSEGDKPEEDVDEANPIILMGAGLGIKTNTTHIEFGVVLPPTFLAPEEDVEYANESDNENKDMFKAIFVFEMKYSGLTVGYIGSYFAGGFSDAEQTVFNQLVYENKDNRLEHGINFSLGSSKGLSLGGSITMSEVITNEQVPLFGSENIETKVVSKGASVKVSYVF